jgi:hypothetical protein
LTPARTFYVDNNVSADTALALRRMGAHVVLTKDFGLRRAHDDFQLLKAAQDGWMLVTHNRTDFELLHRAWHRWSDAWGTPRQHAGILVIPQLWQPEHAANELYAVVSQRSLAGEYFEHRAASGWRPFQRW